MPATDLQRTFFAKLKSVIPHEQLAVNVSNVLQVSPGEAYKKISGKSLINIEQILLIFNRFKVNFEYIPVQSVEKILFS